MISIIFHVHPFTKAKAPGLELRGGRSGRSGLAGRFDSIVCILIHTLIYVFLATHIYILHIVNVEFLNLHVNSFYNFIHSYVIFNIFLKVNAEYNTVISMCTYTYSDIVSYRHTSYM